MPRGLIIDGLKRLEKALPARRQAFSDIIKSKLISYAISSVTVDEIDEMNILNAAQLAMRRAVAGLNPQPNLILVDGKHRSISPYYAVPVIKAET